MGGEADGPERPAIVWFPRSRPRPWRCRAGCGRCFEARHRKVVRTCAIWEAPEFSRRKSRLLEIFITRLNSGDSPHRHSHADTEQRKDDREKTLAPESRTSSAQSRQPHGKPLLNPKEVANIALKLSLDLRRPARCRLPGRYRKRRPGSGGGDWSVPETVDLDELSFHGRQPPVTAFNTGEAVFCTGRLRDGQMIHEDGLCTVTSYPCGRTRPSWECWSWPPMARNAQV